MTRLSCCKPIGYDGASQTLVHGPLCDRFDEPLSAGEYAEYRSRLAHPAKGTRVPPRLVERTYVGEPRRGRNYAVHVGPNHCADCCGWED